MATFPPELNESRALQCAEHPSGLDARQIIRHVLGSSCDQRPEVVRDWDTFLNARFQVEFHRLTDIRHRFVEGLALGKTARKLGNAGEVAAFWHLLQPVVHSIMDDFENVHSDRIQQAFCGRTAKEGRWGCNLGS